MQDTEPETAPDKSLPSVYECVWGGVNVTSVVKCYEESVDWKSAMEMQVSLP